MTPLTSDEQDAHDMTRLAQGHDAALNDLMERHGQRVFHFLLRSLRSDDDAADLAQETFVRVYQNRKKFNPSQKFTPWLYAIAGNLIRDRFRWRARHPQVSIDSEFSDSGTGLKDTLQAADAMPDEVAQANERSIAVSDAIAALPSELREPLILSVYEGLSHAEIGETLRCSVKAVETRIYRARNQLRELLAKPSFSPLFKEPS